MYNLFKDTPTKDDASPKVDSNETTPATSGVTSTTVKLPGKPPPPPKSFTDPLKLAPAQDQQLSAVFHGSEYHEGVMSRDSKKSSTTLTLASGVAGDCQPSPGAIRVSWNSSGEDPTIVSTMEQTAETAMESTTTTDLENPPTPQVVATIAPDTKQLVAAAMAQRDSQLPVAEIMEKEKPKVSTCSVRKILVLLLLLVAVIVGVVLGVVLAGRGGEDRVGEDGALEEGDPQGPDGTHLTPTFESTSNPTEPPLSWFQMGDKIIHYYSNDESGAAVAISHNGLSIAIGAPFGPSSKGAVYVYRYRTAGWKLQAAIIGETYGDSFGNSVALNDEGTIIAIGLPAEDPQWDEVFTPRPGRVRVYHIQPLDVDAPDYDYFLEYGNYEQLGSDIVGFEVGDEFGFSVDISQDGSVVAVGSSKICLARVYAYDGTARAWNEQPSGDLEMVCLDNNSDSSFGVSVALSSNGTTLAVGAPGEVDLDPNNFHLLDGVNGAGPGAVQVFQFEQGAWVRHGQQVVGEAEGDAFGYSIALSDNGMVLAVASPMNDVDQGPAIDAWDFLHSPSIGSCRIFAFNTTLDLWEQRGMDIDGEGLFDRFGTSVSLSSSGDVVAIGAPGGNDSGDDSGYVRVFEYNSARDEWKQVGGRISGPFAFAQAGRSVALSAFGDAVIVGAANTLPESGDQTGDVRVFETGVLQKGDFPITVVIHSEPAEEPPVEDWVRVDFALVNWRLERLDVDREDAVVIKSVVSKSIPPGQEELYPLLVEEGGLYRFVICCQKKLFDYEIHLGDGSILTADHPVVQGFGNFTEDQKQHSFIAQSENNTLVVDPPETQPVTLEILFDDRPEDVHWVILRTEMTLVDTSTQFKPIHTVLAFGPEEEYSGELAGTTLRQTIELPLFHGYGGGVDEFKFIITDTGRDGICCSNGAGSYKLFKGLLAGDEDSLLFSSSNEGGRREVHNFFLSAIED